MTCALARRTRQSPKAAIPAGRLGQGSGRARQWEGPAGGQGRGEAGVREVCRAVIGARWWYRPVGSAWGSLVVSASRLSLAAKAAPSWAASAWTALRVCSRPAGRACVASLPLSTGTCDHMLNAEINSEESGRNESRLNAAIAAGATLAVAVDVAVAVAVDDVGAVGRRKCHQARHAGLAAAPCPVLRPQALDLVQLRGARFQIT